MLDICVGILHPGEMGCTVGAAANNVSSVIWASEGISVNTAARAAAVSLEDAGTLDALVRRSAVIGAYVRHTRRRKSPDWWPTSDSAAPTWTPMLYHLSEPVR